MINFEDPIGLNNNNNNNKKNIPKRKSKRVPWVDKYRPKKLDDIIYQNAVVSMLKTVIKKGNLPHLLLYGPSGCGKTSVALCIAMELFGPRKIKDRIIELNASDERGINVVRNKIISFAKGAIGNGDPKYPSPPYKIIILDEADAMTTEAQSALRKTIEKYSHITRFIFICNYIRPIIGPIISRCVIFRLKPITKTLMSTKLIYIAENEGIKIGKNIINYITSVVDGDMRRAIMLLQNLKYIYNTNGIITIDDINYVIAFMPKKIIDDIKQCCIYSSDGISYENLEASATDFTKIIHIANQIILCGYPIYGVMKQIHDMVISNDHITDKMKCIICEQLSIVDDRLLNNGDEYLQLLSVLLCIKRVTMNIKVNI
uniref:Replication factor C protein n=1 Tax=Mimivirus LCMiAC01 TaxID=2506608 RepID=A0A481Z171_9VIRU|nr:MAG: replication factor C protein [Mimivirus LCMiAC01]